MGSIGSGKGIIGDELGPASCLSRISAEVIMGILAVVVAGPFAALDWAAREA